MQLYSVHDSKAGMFSPPFVARSNGEACRMVLLSAKPDTLLHKFPEDYSVYELGSFDEVSGAIKPINPVSISRVSTLLAVGGSNAA